MKVALTRNGITLSSPALHPLRRPLGRSLAGALALALLAGWRCALAAPVTLMSYNLYLGADLTPLATAPSVPAFIGAAGTAFANVNATDFNDRANAIADQILATGPQFIGLQEVTTWRTGQGLDPAPATTVAYDFLGILGNALTARGLSYTPIAAVQNLDVEVPAATTTGLIDIRLTDQDVLLARTDLPPGVTYANAQAQNFSTAVTLTVAGMPITFLRGWNSADVTVDGETFRLVNTHLEPISELARLAQAQELLNGPGNTPLPLVLIGDLNTEAAPPAAAPGGATYASLLAAGFLDALAAAGIGDQSTCCQDADLLNPASLLSSRIDLALVRGGLEVLSAEVVGEAQADRSALGLWPSDHAGIVVTLQVPEPSTVVLLVVPGALLALRGMRRRRGAPV
jgi:Endonuclease/Exonuclease/phosphatase family